MKPDFDDLIDDDDSRDDLAELRQVHELLLSASPPPALTKPLARSPRARTLIPRSWALGAAGLAAAAAAAIGIGVGALVSGGGGGTGWIRPMHGVGAAATARAVLRVGKEDSSGNRELTMSVRSLPEPRGGGWYELFLTKKGKPVAVCGIFRTGRGGSAHVTMNVPADLGEYDGWVITAAAPAGHAPVLLST
jgi:hypothetical protein